MWLLMRAARSASTITSTVKAAALSRGTMRVILPRVRTGPTARRPNPHRCGDTSLARARWPACLREAGNWRTLPSVMTRHPGVPPASDPASRAAEPPLAPSGPPVSFRNLYPRYPGYTPRRDGGLGAYETVLGRAGFAPVAGIDEAGRGACAGPLVVAAVVLDPAGMSGLTEVADSKALSPAVREIAYLQVTRLAVAWHVVVIPSTDIDRLGLHVCNLAGMRRALAGLACRPGYVLTDGFPVRGLAVPALAMWQGDEVAACVAAASVVAKVTRDRIMTAMEERYPAYGFSAHKGCAP